jgi:hypothetical protein
MGGVVAWASATDDGTAARAAAVRVDRRTRAREGFCTGAPVRPEGRAEEVHGKRVAGTKRWNLA